MKEVDVAIVGCGLAGAAVAWQSHRRGLRVAIIDRCASSTSSRVAAGLVTPVTGSRGAMSWEWSWFYNALSEFYPWVERRVGCRFWFPAPTIKIFLSEEERHRYCDRWFNDSHHPTDTSFGMPWARAEDLPQSIGLSTPWGGCELSPAARLSTIDYLNATRSYFEARDEFREIDLLCDRDIQAREKDSIIEPLEIQAKNLVFCQGVEARKNPWFSVLPLHPARGDILTISTELPLFDARVIHHEAWIVPLGPQLFRIGATYDRFTLDDIVDSRPSVSQARNELLQRWKSVLGYATKPTDAFHYEVVEHQAAVRPASYDRKPLIGRHPIFANVYCLNGLGSKGSLMAPRLAMHLLDAMDGAVIDSRLNWNRKS